MKRAVELQPLSREHRDALIQARSLRRAAAGEGDLDAAVHAFLVHWEAEIEPHFLAEERILVPRAEAALGAGDPMLARLLSEHAALRRVVRDLARAKGETVRSPAAELGRALDAHVRFEERLLFPAVEVALAGDALAALGRDLEKRAGDACAIAARAAG